MRTPQHAKDSDEIINRLLQEIGFSDKESLVYLTLLERGPLSVPSLVELTGINRTTIYSVANQLIEKGILVEDLARKKGGFIAMPPDSLLKIVNRAETEVRHLRGRVERLALELKKLEKISTYPVPKVSLIPEDQIAEHITSQTHRLIADAIQYGNRTMWGFTDSTYLQNYEDTVQQFLQQTKTKQVTLNLIGERGDAEYSLNAKQYTNRQVKYWHKTFDFTCSMWVFGTYVIMVITRQRPYYLLEIHDEVLANNLRLVFQGLWEHIPYEE